MDALSPDEARRLAVQLLGQLPAAEEVARESGGNPFFVHELARAASSGVGPGPAEGSVSLDRVLWQRIERLPAGAKGLLEVVATAGRPLRQTDAARAAGLGAEMLPALTLLRGQRFVRNVGSAGEGVVIAYHDRVRETVLAHLPPDASRDVHRRLAAVLEESGQADPELLAVHYQGAGEPERAGRHYAAAADNAARILAFDQAARLYRLSLQLNPPAGAEECRLRTKLGDALTSAGRGAEAAAEYLRAAAGMEGNASLELRRRAAMQLLVSGRQDEGRDVLRTVLAAVGLKLTASSGQAIFTLLFRRFQLWLRGLQFTERSADQVPEKDLIRIDTCWSAAVGLSMTDNVVGSGFQAQHLLLSLAAGEPSRVALSLGLEIGLSGLPGARTRPRTAAITRQATALAERVGSHQALGLIALWGGAARAWCEGAWQETHREGERADAIFREHCTGVAWERATAQVFSLAALGWMGEWKRHGERLPALLREAAERGDQYGLTTLPLLTYSYVLDLAADEPARARERIREAMKHWSPRGVDLQQLWALYGEWETDLYCGDPARAWAGISHHQAAVKASFPAPRADHSAVRPARAGPQRGRDGGRHAVSGPSVPSRAPPVAGGGGGRRPDGARGRGLGETPGPDDPGRPRHPARRPLLRPAPRGGRGGLHGGGNGPLRGGRAPPPRPTPGRRRGPGPGGARGRLDGRAGRAQPGPHDGGLRPRLSELKRRPAPSLAAHAPRSAAHATRPFTPLFIPFIAGGPLSARKKSRPHGTDKDLVGI